MHLLYNFDFNIDWASNLSKNVLMFPWRLVNSLDKIWETVKILCVLCLFSLTGWSLYWLTDRVVFSWGSKVFVIALVLLHALWLVQRTRATTQTIRCKTKTNRDLVSRVFPRLTPVAWILFEYDWLIMLFTFSVIGHRKCFAFGFTTKNWKPL